MPITLSRTAKILIPELKLSEKFVIFWKFGWLRSPAACNCSILKNLLLFLFICFGSILPVFFSSSLFLTTLRHFVDTS